MTPMDAEKYMDAAAEALGLSIAPEWRPGVAGFLAIAAGMAATVEAAPLDEDELSPAPVFRLPD